MRERMSEMTLPLWGHPLTDRAAAVVRIAAVVAANLHPTALVPDCGPRATVEGKPLEGGVIRIARAIGVDVERDGTCTLRRRWQGTDVLGYGAGESPHPPPVRLDVRLEPVRRLAPRGVSVVSDDWAQLEVQLDLPAETIVVTRHRPLVAYLIEIGMISPEDEVREHVTADEVRDRHVIGVLPLSLAALARSVTEVPLALTRADREAMGRDDLPLERIREIAGPPTRYVVEVD